MIISRAELAVKIKAIIQSSKSTSEAINKIDILIKDCRFITLSARELFYLYEHQ
jgi:hypothetical protein